MEALKSTDRFRQLLKQFNQSQQPTNVKPNPDTSVRKSTREVKKPVKYDSSPYRSVAVAKGPKRTERRGTPVENRDRSGGRKEKSKEHLTDTEAPVVSRTSQQDLREESLSRAPLKQRSAFTRVVANENNTPPVTRQPMADRMRRRDMESSFLQERNRREEYETSHVPKRRQQDYETSHVPKRRQQDYETSHVPDRRRQQDYEASRDLETSSQQDYETSHVPERRRQQEYESILVPGRRLADKYTDGARGVFLKPQPVLSNQSRSNPSQYYDLYSSVRQPVVRLHDVTNPRNQSVLHCSRIDMPPLEIRQPSVKLLDVMKSQERAKWQNSRKASPPQDRPKRFDGAFLRPPTPPGTAELAQKEQSTFFDTVSEFRNFPLFTTAEVIFHLNQLEESLIHKMSKTIRKRDKSQSVSRMTMMEDTSKSYMIQSWLKSNETGTTSRLVDDSEVNSKRMREPSDYEYTKRMRVAPGEERQSYQQDRDMRHRFLSRS